MTIHKGLEFAVPQGGEMKTKKDDGPDLTITRDDWVEHACPGLPPSPPGWDEWWAQHREHVSKVIGQAREQMGRQIEYDVIKLLEKRGHLPDPLASMILKRISMTYEGKA